MGKSSSETYVIFETAAGYCLVNVVEWDIVTQQSVQFQQAVQDASAFLRIVQPKAYLGFKDAETALANMQAIVEGKATDQLIEFLVQNIPKKLKHVQLGVNDPNLGRAIHEKIDVKILCSHEIDEVLRGCRTHIKKLVGSLEDETMTHFQVGLAHSYSRAKLQLNPNKSDKHISQSIAHIDTMDKAMNKTAMRVKEWYGWHFPELAKIIVDSVKYCQLCMLIKIRDNFDFEGRKDEMMKILDSQEDLVDQIIAASKAPMGMDITEMDMLNIEQFAVQCIQMAKERSDLVDYMNRKLALITPNLQIVAGSLLAARLIAHAGSSVNLAKCPASTIQILGAEKALFRSLKTKTNTPKFGLIFASPYIGKVHSKKRGRMSRCLANKLALAVRTDCFAEESNESIDTSFGEQLRKQLDERSLKLLK